jgi:hypothetical protein
MAIDEKTSQDLDTLLAGGDTVEGLYGELRSSFDAEKVAVTSEDQLRAFRDRWAGRKNGLLTRANDHWLKKAPREFKPQVGRLQTTRRRTLKPVSKPLSQPLNRHGSRRAALMSHCPARRA